jgi:PTS system fructose-specific IIC component
MIPIGDILQPDHVNLSLSATDKVGAVEEVLSKLNGDPRVKDFSVLRQAVLSRDAAAISENHCGICIAHGRTESVSGLVMAAGRSPAGFPCRDVPDPVRLVFVAGIPGTFNSEYLRIVGAIARICRDKHQLERLLAARDADYFVGLLGAGEVKL